MTTITDQFAGQASAAAKAATPAINGDFNLFIKMLTTQLQNQDPLKPMDTAQFTEQLVSYSQVEQAIKGNEKLEQLHTLLGGQALSQAVSLIGRDVAIDVPMSVLGDDGARWEYNLAASSSQVKLEIVDQKGNVVRTLQGEKKAGIHELSWDGKDDSGKELPKGLYTLKVSATNDAGNEIRNWVAARGIVQSIHFEGGVPLLDLGGASVKLENILTVKAASEAEA